MIDGPFIESKEVIGGYAILRAGSLAEAIKMGEEFLQIHLDVLGPEYETDLEVREMSEAPECGAKVDQVRIIHPFTKGNP